MKRKAIIILVVMIILFGLAAWQPAAPISVTRSFITPDCLVQSPTQSNTVSLDTAVPSCWLVNQIQ